jgi:molybdopterin molybdotransferase
MDERRRESGFRERTRIDDARERLRERVSPVGRTETLPVADADGRTLAAAVAARRAVPGETRAAVDGFAVAASATFGASDRSPALLAADASIGDTEDTRGARRVDAGDPMPSTADAVVSVGGATRVDDTVEVFDPVAVCDGVSTVGSDVAADESLYEPDHRLRPPDLGLLLAAGVETVAVRDRSRVAVVPTGDGLVTGELGPGESVETDSLTVARLVERWGGVAERHESVPADRPAIAEALRDAAADADVVATTGGSGLGRDDLVPDALATVGELAVHGVAAKPGESLGLGAVDGTPVVVLPGGPAACVVGAVQFLRPAVTWADGREHEEPPTGPAMLARKVPSEPGIRTYVRVRFDAEGGQRVAVPIRSDGPLSHSSVGLADGWIEIREGIEGLPEGDLVAVQRWGWSP